MGPGIGPPDADRRALQEAVESLGRVLRRPSRSRFGDLLELDQSLRRPRPSGFSNHGNKDQPGCVAFSFGVGMQPLRLGVCSCSRQIHASRGGNDLGSLGRRDGKVKCDRGSLLPRRKVDVGGAPEVGTGPGVARRGRQKAWLFELSRRQSNGSRPEHLVPGGVVATSAVAASAASP